MISNTVTAIQQLSTGANVAYPYPNKIFAASDLAITAIDLSGAAHPVSAAVSLVDVDTGCLVTLSAPLPAGWTLDIRTNTPETQPTSIKNQGQFLPDLHEEAFDRITREVQDLYRLAYTYGIHGPDTEKTPWPVLPQPLVRANMGLVFDGNGLPTVGALATIPITSSLVNSLLTALGVGSALYPQTPAEIAAGVTPTNYVYPPGHPRRFGALGNGVADDTVAVQSAINSCGTYTGDAGDIYGVSTVTFPLGGPTNVNFNGSQIRGIASVPTNCIIAVQCAQSNFYDYNVDGHFSNQYLCGTWWYNATSSSQYNSFFGCKHYYLGGINTAHNQQIQAMIFGALIGQVSTNFAQSENAIYGWRTVGCLNPLLMNHAQGYLHLSEPIFVTDTENWASYTYNGSEMALQILAGNLYVQGGEIQASQSATPQCACQLQNCFLVSMNFEIASPVTIIGDSAVITNSHLLVNPGIFAIVAASTCAAGATFALRNSDIGRAAAVGTYDETSMINASAANPLFQIILEDSISKEWRWQLTGVDCRLIQGGVQHYLNHRMQMTATVGTGYDNNWYILNNSPNLNLVEGLGFDRLGYTTTGWALVNNSGAATMTATTTTGPSGYNAAQITLTAASANSRATYGDSTSLASLRSTALHIGPTELYWLSAWIMLASGASASLSAYAFDNTGAFVNTITVADQTVLVAGKWKFVEGPVNFAATPTGAYMVAGVAAVNSVIAVTDLRIRRAA